MWNAVATVDTANWLLGLFAPGGITVLAGYLAVEAGTPWHLVIFYATGVGAFVSVFYFYARKIVDRQTVFRKIKIGKIFVADAHVTSKEKKIHWLTMAMTIENKSERELYFSVDRITHSVSNRSPDSRKKTERVESIQPGDSIDFGLSTVSDVDVVDDLKGYIDVDVRYGAQKNRMRFIYHYEGVPGILMRFLDGKVNLRVATAITQASHRRLSWDERHDGAAN